MDAWILDDSPGSYRWGSIEAPEPGKNVQVVPADLGSEFAGAIRVNPAQAASVAGHVA